MSSETHSPRRQVACRIALAVGIVGGLGWSLAIRRVAIDLTSARQAESLHFLGLEFTRRVEHTSVSKLLRDASAVVDEPYNWRTAAEWSLWRPDSPHFVQHGSPAEIERIALIQSLTNASDEETVQVAGHVLELLRQDKIGPATAVVDHWWIDRRHLAE